MPISSRATPRGRRVSLSSVMQYLTSRQHRQVADRDGEARVGGAAQQPVELLDLAALALPSHPQAFALVPLAEPMEQEEAVGAAVGVLGVERGDARARPRPGSPRRAAASRSSASRKSLSRAKWMCGSRLPSACTSRCASRSSTRSHAVEQRRHDHHRSRRRGHRVELEPRQPARRNQVADHPLQHLNGQLAGRHERQQRDEQQRRAAPAVARGVGHGAGDQQRRCRRRSCRDSSGVAHRKEEPPDPLSESRAPGRRCVRTRAARRQSGGSRRATRARRASCACDLPRALDALQREQQLAVAGRLGQLLDRVAIAVAAAEVHPRVDGRRDRAAAPARPG